MYWQFLQNSSSAPTLGVPILINVLFLQSQLLVLQFVGFIWD